MNDNEKALAEKLLTKALEPATGDDVILVLLQVYEILVRSSERREQLEKFKKVQPAG